ncbi:hypothetical protein GCM10010260_24930 [Streptomyces filipinensis]|uniref:Uncharacterized protein n=1 Tax=Streptomyces filipinensis TaxID=66887 RepID=A0A918IA27_9ACTN|nr:hypothetical protein GCM10010260_24930 [Streptomyces filipinensis]
MGSRQARLAKSASSGVLHAYDVVNRTPSPLPLPSGGLTRGRTCPDDRASEGSGLEAADCDALALQQGQVAHVEGVGARDVAPAWATAARAPR